MTSTKANFIGLETLQADGATKRNQGVVRGHGTLELDDGALVFVRSVPKLEIRVPYAAIEDVSIGRSHNGKWVFGYPAVKIAHSGDDGDRILGLIVGRRAEAERRAQEISLRVAEAPG